MPTASYNTSTTMHSILTYPITSASTLLSLPLNAILQTHIGMSLSTIQNLSLSTSLLSAMAITTFLDTMTSQVSLNGSAPGKQHMLLTTDAQTTLATSSSSSEVAPAVLTYLLKCVPRHIPSSTPPHTPPTKISGISSAAVAFLTSTKIPTKLRLKTEQPNLESITAY